MDSLEYLLDRQAISDLLIRYGMALDDRDWARLESCFTPDAQAIYGGEIGLQKGYKAIEKTCREALEPLDASQHIITNHEIEIDGDTARARSYLHAQQTKYGMPGGENFTIAGTYIDDLIKTSDGWKIRKRELVIAWQTGNPAVMGG